MGDILGLVNLVILLKGEMTMKRNTSEQAKVDALNAEYKAYVDRLRAKWTRQNRVDSNDVFEVMHPSEREEVYRVITRWAAYITPLAEAWWRRRGYGVIWPDDNSKPMKLCRLESA